MKPLLHKLYSAHTIGKHLFPARCSKKFPGYLLTILMILPGFINGPLNAQGTWTRVTAAAPDPNGGGLLLLSDGSVICKSFSGGGDGIGNIYNKLTPDASGSYVNGTWSSIAPMNKTRLYYSSQVLKDGRVYVCGGEYGSGGSFGETYDPLTNVWTMAPSIGSFVSDANSEIAEDGRVMQALVTGTLNGTKIYNPVTNTYSNGPTCIGIHNESTWLKIADGSWLMVDRGTRNSERFIPSLGKWVADATLPNDLYDGCGLEFGTAALLPDGRSYWVGATGHTAIYTPSGNSSPGSWAAAADLPNNQGQPDAAGAIMVDGKILLATSPKPSGCNVFQTPTSYYVYDYITDTYTRIPSPDGDATDNVPCYYSAMLCLPNGQILYGLQHSNQYYVFTPNGPQINTNKPKINKIEKISNTAYRITGTGFNGNSEGAVYGDDWQMNTNYPIIRATSGTNVYYGRTYNWNSTGLMRGLLPDTVYVSPPAGLGHGTFSIVVTANGIASDPVTVTVGPGPAAELYFESGKGQSNELITAAKKMKIYPNPARNQATIQFTMTKTSHVFVNVTDLGGKALQTLFDGNLLQGDHSMLVNLSHLSPGIYYLRKTTESGTEITRLAVQ